MKTLKQSLCLISALLLLGPAAPVKGEGSFSLEEVLSCPYPWNLVSAKKADRIAWMFNAEGARNIWTAAAPDYVPINLTGYVQDEVFEIPDVAISDDGRLVVYVRGGNPNREGWITNPTSDPDGLEQAIWAVRTDGGNPWRVCAGNGPVLSPDGRWILFTAGNDIWKVSLRDPGPSGRQADPEILFKAQGRNADPQWSPDGRFIAFTSYRGDHSFIGIYSLPDHTITWIAPSVDRDSDSLWSPDGTRILFQRRPGAQYGGAQSFGYRNRPTGAFWVADVKTGDARLLWQPDPEAEMRWYTTREVMWAGDDRILFTAEHDNWNHVYVLDMKGGNPIDLTPGEGFIEHLQLSADGKFLFVSSNQADIQGRHIWKVPVRGGRPVQLTEGATLGSYPVALGSGKDVAFMHATARHPLSIALVPADGGQTRVIAPRSLPKTFPLAELVIPELVTVKAEDGLEISCQLFLPRGAKAGDGRPGVVFTHGGPIRQMLLGWHYMEFYSEAYGINQYFASRGYVVISINYRSGIGYGRSFRNAPKTGRRGASEYQDVLAGTKYLLERPEVDPERVGLWGLSYGGLLTAMGLARNSDIFKAGVDLAGVHDWSQRGNLSGEARKIAFESSPVASVKSWTSPVLFIHGDDDRNVDFSQTVDLVQKLRAKGDVPIELFICPDEPHEFMLWENRMEGYRRTFEFLDRHLSRNR